ncbi:MAG TPA: LEPR-XLL domain-containing protein, partial [Burkholderiales bacterium]
MSARPPQRPSMMDRVLARFGRPAAPGVRPAKDPPSPPATLTGAIGAAFRAQFPNRPARPLRRRPVIEPLEPRILLSAEVPVIPPAPLVEETALIAPLEFGVSPEGAELVGQMITGLAPQGAALPAPEVARFADDWGEVNLAGTAPRVLDFSAVTRDLR